MSKNRFKIVPKMLENNRKSSLGAVLEHFGEPLGAKMAQERQQERKYMNNVDFRVARGCQNGAEIDEKSDQKSYEF